MQVGKQAMCPVVRVVKETLLSQDNNDNNVEDGYTYTRTYAYDSGNLEEEGMESL